MQFESKKNIILASGSPRRQELLTMAGIPFETVTSGVDEDLDPALYDVYAYAEQLAAEKANAVSEKHPDSLVIGADTIVVYDGEVLGKPQSKEEAKQYLEALSGNVHEVITAVAIADEGQLTTFHSVTKVTFYPIDEPLLERYLALDEPYDKAGGYGIQSVGALFVKQIEGDYYTVMGLPIAELVWKLRMSGRIELVTEGGVFSDR